MFLGNAGLRLIVVALLLAGAVAPGVAVGQPTPAGDGATVGQEATPPANGTAGGDNGTGDGDGGGGGPFQLFHTFTEWFDDVAGALSNPMEAFQDYAEKIVEMLVERPVPLRNGDPAWVQKPDGDVMGAVYDITWSLAIPLAMALTIIYAGLAVGFRALVPPSLVPPRVADGAVWEAVGKVFHVIFSWTIMVGWLVICRAVSQWAAPSGEQIFPGGQGVVEQVVAGGLGGILLWLSSGVLVLLAVLVWGLGWMGAVFAPFLYPVLVAAKPPDLPLLRKLKMLPTEGMLVAMAATPVPTALILGGGYPIINGIRRATDGPVASMAGIPLTVFLTLAMWVAALIAPILMIAGARQLRPAAMFTAGLLGATTAMSAKDKMQNLPDVDVGGAGGGGGSGGTMAAAGGAGSSVDPLAGSPFSRASTDGGTGGAMAAGGTGGAAGALGAGGAGSGAASGGFGAAPAASTGAGGPPGVGSTTSSSGMGSAASSASTVSDTARSVGSLEEVPGGQTYEVGFENSAGEWQAIRDNDYSREWLVDDGAINRFSDAFADEDLHVRGVESGDTFDISGAVGGDSKP